MSIKRKLILWGVVLGLFVAAALGLNVLWNEVSEFDLYPMGMGRHEDSPNGIYEASASNMTDRIDGKIVQYYQFEVVRKSDSKIVAEKKLPDEQQKIRFRQGNGKIFWKDDSSGVRFGTTETTLWTHALIEKGPGEQGGAGQPATRSESDSEGGDKPHPESEGRSR